MAVPRPQAGYFVHERRFAKFMKIQTLLWTLPLATMMGCVYSHRPATYTAVTPHRATVVAPATAVVVPAPPSTATSTRSDVRVYQEPKLSITAPVPPPIATKTLPGVIATSDPRDITVTDEVRQMLETDATRLYRNVDFEIDKGKVTLRGMVPTDHDRIELQNRVAAMPGVQAVVNRLDVELR